jgi:hypothetical protein
MTPILENKYTPRIMLIVAIVLGLAIWWVDSRPHWDDTGITAAMVLFVTGLLGLMVPRRAWIWGLAVGVWIPLGSILQHQSYAAILALIIAFIGAYGGALLRHVASTLV